MELDLNKTKITLYNKYCREYEERTKDYSGLFLEREIKLFLEALNGKLILDVGSGPGRDSKIFYDCGFLPVCADISLGMLSLCKSKSLMCTNVSFETFCFKENSFDGIWAYTSLTTTTKASFEKIIKSICNLLKPDGIFFIGMIEGEGEGWRGPDLKYSIPRYRARYSQEELKKILSKYFKIIHESIILKEINGRNTYLNFMCIPIK